MLVRCFIQSYWHWQRLCTDHMYTLMSMIIINAQRRQKKITPTCYFARRYFWFWGFCCSQFNQKITPIRCNLLLKENTLTHDVGKISKMLFFRWCPRSPSTRPINGFVWFKSMTFENIRWTDHNGVCVCVCSSFYRKYWEF